MSIIRCEDCTALIDSDDFPEVFREEFGDAPLCDRCYEESLLERPSASALSP